MKELQLLNYYTVYSYSSIDARGNKHLIFNRTNAICFVDLFSILGNCPPKGEYTLFVSTDLKTLREHRCNYCFLNKAGIIRHLKQAQQVVPEFVSFTVTPAEYRTYSGYEITLIINKANKIVHKYVLTWVRYLYESSFSLALLDVTKLAKLPKFRFVSYANLLNVVQACFPEEEFPNHNTWHAIGTMCPHNFLTRKELKQCLPEKTSLNTIYSVKNYQNLEKLPTSPKLYNIDYWESNDTFINERLPIYEKLFDMLKETN